MSQESQLANTVPKNRQNTLGADNADGVAALSQPPSLGGMRGIGVAAMLVAQVALKFKTLELMRDYYNANLGDFNFFVATYEPASAASAAEVMSPTQNPAYAQDQYASTAAGMAASKNIDQQWFGVRRRMHRYAVGAQNRVDYEYALLRGAALVSGWNAGRRYEQAWADAHNERRINRQIAMANVGIQAGNIIRAGLATAVSGLGKAYDSVGDSLAAIGNGYYELKGSNDGRDFAKARLATATKDAGVMK